MSGGTGILAGAGAEKAFPCRGEEMGLNPLCFPDRDTLIFTIASSMLTYSLSAGSCRAPLNTKSTVQCQAKHPFLIKPRCYR